MKKILALALAMVLFLGGIGARSEEAAPTYTYNEAVIEFPTLWDPLRAQSVADRDLASMVSGNLYRFDYNDTKDGYQVVPEMAVGFPQDVTSEYVGEAWGIEAGETARAWRITLRQDAVWDDGTPITAADFEASARLRLNPQAQNAHAENFFADNLEIVNAEAYAKQHVTADTSLRAIIASLGAKDVHEALERVGDLPAKIDWYYSFGDTYNFQSKSWTGAAEEGIVDAGVTLRELYDFYTVGAGGEYITWADDAGKAEYALDELYARFAPFDSDVDWDQVGFKAVGEYQFDIVLKKPLEGFYLLYAMIDGWLVKADVYEALATMQGGSYANTYGTTAETTPSCGPYKLVDFQPGQMYRLERNDSWYGYKDHAEWGQATALQYEYVPDPAMAFDMFLSGQLDRVNLEREYLEDYGTSPYAYYEESDTVYGMVFNPDMDALLSSQAAAGRNINKTILTEKNFRMAMSLGLDRASFCLATLPTHRPAFALYGGKIVVDPDQGIFYRNTDVAKKVVVDFWALTGDVGAGKQYATMDDAIASITGYDLKKARELFNAAYDQAIKDGLMDEDDVVQITVGTANVSDGFYIDGYDFIVNNYTEAVKGTKLEGKLTFTRAGLNDFDEALKSNQVDMIFGVGWTGSTFDPFSLIKAYTSKESQYDPVWDTTSAMLQVELGGNTYEASVWDWTQALNGTEVSGKDKRTGKEIKLCFPYSTDEDETAQRYEVLAALENCVLQNYDFIPLMGSTSAHLKGMQIEYYSREEIFPMGYGGILNMTFNYTDAEWEAFVQSQGGRLNYK